MNGAEYSPNVDTALADHNIRKMPQPAEAQLGSYERCPDHAREENQATSSRARVDEQEGRSLARRQNQDAREDDGREKGQSRRPLRRALAVLVPHARIMHDGGTGDTDLPDRSA
jgi:hypothetical protein